MALWFQPHSHMEWAVGVALRGALMCSHAMGYWPSRDCGFAVGVDRTP